MPSLGASFGFGAATMALWDLENADCIVVMGSNMAENHPVAFRFVVEAQRRGATVIHVDPRFTRTSALADIHASIRAGTDIAFLGGIIRHILENDLWFRAWALAYSNIAHVIDARYRDTEENDGVFSGWDPDSQSYKDDTWRYAGRTDETLQHPNCVYQILRRHYARYTPEMVVEITGCPKETFLKVADAIARNSGRERTGCFVYAVGWTHHATGVQIIRAASILQSLLGNMGRPGGGILAARGHASIQGSTDIPTLYDMLPGYLAQPTIFHEHATLDDYLRTETPATGWRSDFPKYAVSLLKAWYGEAAVKANDFCYQHLPKLAGDVSLEPMTLAMANGLIRGQFIFGQNPTVGAANSEAVEKGLAKLKWLVVRDFAMTETADFWRDGRRVRKGEISSEEIDTEVFFLPAAMPGEKDGTLTNTSRLVQWHDHVLEAPGDSRSDLWFMYHLGKRLKALYADSKLARDMPIQDLAWDYPVEGEREEPSAQAVLKEINGYTVADHKQVEGYEALKADGSTACGCWIYSGIFPADDRNLARSRRPDGPGEHTGHQGWAFAWPANRRTLYNRASADPEGRPWSERKKMIWWDEATREWTGFDRPDCVRNKPPDYRPDWSKRSHGMDALRGDAPFIMEAEGTARIFAPSGIKDGPLPTHYEPVESPVMNRLHENRPYNPPARIWAQPGNEVQAPGDPRFPYVFTTYRLTEIHCGGIPSRIMPHTAELQPEAFVEISPELAAELGVEHLGWTVLSSLRGEIEVRALVTERMRPLKIGGRIVHQVGMPWVFGPKGYAHGEPANVLLAITGDPNTSIHSTKALTCNIRPGRMPMREAAE